MDITKLIDVTEREIDGHTFAISKIPAIKAIPIYSAVAKSFTDNGILGITMLQPEMQRAMLMYVAVKDNGEWEEIDTETRMNKYFENFGTLQKVIASMIGKNFGFLMDGSLRELLGIPAEVEGSDS